MSARRARTVDMTGRFVFRSPGPTRRGGRSPELLSRLRQLVSCSVSCGKCVAGPRPGATVDVLVPGVPRPLDAWARTLLLKKIEGKPFLLHSGSRGIVRSDSGKACREGQAGPGCGSRATSKSSRGGAPGKVPGKACRGSPSGPGMRFPGHFRGRFPSD